MYKLNVMCHRYMNMNNVEMYKLNVMGHRYMNMNNVSMYKRNVMGHRYMNSHTHWKCIIIFKIIIRLFHVIFRIGRILLFLKQILSESHMWLLGVDN